MGATPGWSCGRGALGGHSGRREAVGGVRGKGGTKGSGRPECLGAEGTSPGGRGGAQKEAPGRSPSGRRGRPGGSGAQGLAWGARYLQRRRSLGAGPTKDVRPPPRRRRRSYNGPRPHVTRARAVGGAVAGPAPPGVPSARAQWLPWGPGKRMPANDADAEWPGGLGHVVIPHNRGSPLLRGVQCFQNKHALRGLGALGGRGSGAGLRAGAGLGASRGGVGG